jgi:uncharacterized protein YbcI
MLQMDIRNYDRLFELVMRLSAITFLQGALTDEEYVTYNGKEFDYALPYARNALYDEQKKTLLEIKELIGQEDFVLPDGH